MRKQPTTAFPLTLSHVIRGLRGVLDDAGETARFEQAFAAHMESAHAIAAGSGTAAFYLLLAAAARLRPGRDEVVLPAYSVPTLIHAVRLAGLRPVYCDIDRETLNMNLDAMTAAVSDRTLALVPFHLFGFPMPLDRAMEIGRARGVFVFEDACQALGARLGGRPAGSIADAGFFSLCKGKIISTFKGGIVITGNDELAAAARKISLKLPLAGALFRFVQPGLMGALSLAMRPSLYGRFFPLIERFKSTTVHESFHPARFTGYSAGLARTLLPESGKWVTARREIGTMLMEGLRDDSGIIIPRIIPGAEPCFNHVPVVFHDIARLEMVQQILAERGIDTARMYERPVHRIYPELGYPESPDPFPEASYVAPRLLTLPSHPYLSRDDAETMLRTIRGVKG